MKEDKIAIVQNPKNPAPQEILDTLEVIEVVYCGFDDAIHQGAIIINEVVSEDVRKFFDLALKIKFPIKKIIPISDPKYHWDDDISCEDNNSSGFNYRNIGGSNKLSKHAFGLAFDINPVQNIYVRYDKGLKEVFRAPTNGIYNPETPGTLVEGDPLVTLMKNLGWTWGGDWTPESGRIDYQHFEKDMV